jgi:hypothetical protein
MGFGLWPILFLLVFYYFFCFTFFFSLYENITTKKYSNFYNVKKKTNIHKI